MTTKITRRFTEVDVIALVDNAERPMQVSPLAVGSAAEPAGSTANWLSPSHYGQIKGGQLAGPYRKAAIRHGFRTERGTVTEGDHRQQRGQFLKWFVERDAYMMGNLRIGKTPGAVKVQLRRLLERCVAAMEPLAVPNAGPVYNLLGPNSPCRFPRRSFKASGSNEAA